MYDGARGLTACTTSEAVMPLLPPLGDVPVSRSWLPFSSSSLGAPCLAAIASLQGPFQTSSQPCRHTAAPQLHVARS